MPASSFGHYLRSRFLSALSGLGALSSQVLVLIINAVGDAKAGDTPEYQKPSGWVDRTTWFTVFFSHYGATRLTR